MDVKISSDQGGAGEGADQRINILKIFKEIFGGLVTEAVKTDKVKFGLDKVYQGNNMFKTKVPGGGDLNHLFTTQHCPLFCLHK